MVGLMCSDTMLKYLSISLLKENKLLINIEKY